jgi:molybdopterin synthase sulfur carrier subunit
VAEHHPLSTVRVTVRYFAAARTAAGVTEETLQVGSVEPDGDKGDLATTVGAVVTEITVRHGPDLARVLPRCSFLLDEVAVHGVSTPVRDGQALDVLPPFAGG